MRRRARLAGALLGAAIAAAVALRVGRSDESASLEPAATSRSDGGEHVALAELEPEGSPARDSLGASDVAAREPPDSARDTEPGLTARVFVREEASKPIADARVTAFLGPRELVLITDEQGLALVPIRASDDSVPLLVEADGFFHERRPFLTGEDIVVRLASRATLSGRVLESGRGNPVAGATVAFRHPSCRRCPVDSVVTDGTGTFRGLEVFAGYRVELWVSAPGFPSRRTTVLLEPGESSLDLAVLEPGVRVTGTVIDSETGIPLQRGSVAPVGQEEHPLELAQGRFDGLFLPSASGRVSLSVMGDGYCRARYELDVATYDGAPLTLPLPRIARVVMSLHDPEGGAIADARIRTLPWGGQVDPRTAESPLHALPYVRLDSPGRWGFEVLEDGRYRSGGAIPWSRTVEIWVEHDDYRTAHEQFDVGPPGSTTDVDVVLRPLPPAGSTTLRGRVTFGNEAADGGTVAWFQPPRHGLAKLSTSGAYVIAGLREGEVELHPAPSLDGYSLRRWARAHPVVVRCEGADVERDIDLPVPMGHVAGQVVRPDGSPVEGRMVWLASQATSDEGIGRTTDADGRFAFRAPMEGVYELIVWQGLTSPRRADLRPDADVQIVLPDYGSLLIEVVDGESGAPLADADVRIRVLEEDSHLDGWFTPLQIESLPLADEVPGGSVGPGTTRVDLSPGDVEVAVRGAAIGYLPSGRIQATVRASEVTELRVELERGHDLLVRAHAMEGPSPALHVLETGSPPDLLRARSPTDEPGERFATDATFLSKERRLEFASGTARIRGLAVGDYRFVASMGSWRFEPPLVHVGPGEVTEVELAWFPVD